MTFKSMLAPVSVAVVLAHIAPARAQDEAPRPVVVTLDAGIYLPTGRLMTGAADPGPPIYVGGTFEVQLARALDLALSGGAAAGLGAILGVTAGYAMPWFGPFRFTAGAGPMLITDAEFGSAAFAQGDLGLELRSHPGAATGAGVTLAAGLGMAFALNHAGTPGCGVDTCNSWVSPGDRLVLLRLGIGVNF